jgi:hypothetical protein
LKQYQIEPYLVFAIYYKTTNDNKNKQKQIMSEHEEFSALTEWMATFPQLREYPYYKENSTIRITGEYLSNPHMAE